MLLRGTADAWESTRDHGALRGSTAGRKLTAPLPCCPRQGLSAQAAAATGSPAVPRVCLRQRCLWLLHKCQNVIGLLSATYPSPFGTHSASKNSPSRGKEYVPKIAPPLGLASAGADTWSGARPGFAGRFQPSSPTLSKPKTAAATSPCREASRCFATPAQSSTGCRSVPPRGTAGDRPL